MKKRIYWVLVILHSFVWSYGQMLSSDNYGIFHMNNGSIYIGEVIEEQDTELQLRLADGNLITVNKYLVKEYFDHRDIKVFDGGKYQVFNGTFCHLSFGFNFGNLMGESDNRVSSTLPFQYLNHFTPRIAAGVGIGFEFFESEVSGFDFNTQFVPLYAYGRYYINESKRRPFFYSRIGYGFKAEGEELQNEHEGGFQYQGGIGLLFASKSNTRFVLSLGYHFQKTSGMESFIDNFGNEISTRFKINIQRIILSIGMEFGGKKRKYN